MIIVDSHPKGVGIFFSFLISCKGKNFHYLRKNEHDSEFYFDNL